MPAVGFEPTISAGERPQTYALDRVATGISIYIYILVYVYIYIYIYIYIYSQLIPTYLAACFGSSYPSSGQFLVYGHGAFNDFARYGNAPCLCIKNWPKAGSLEPKHVANYILTIYILCLSE
jgi:hypothetical protein